MERQALEALEKRVAALRVLTAEKAVLARSLAHAKPIRFHDELSTAILALAVLVVFLFGRQAGMFAAESLPCSALAPGERAWITLATDRYVVTLDTSGYVSREATSETARPGHSDRRVSPDEVRAIANRLAEGCFLERRSHGGGRDSRVSITLRTSERTATYRHSATMPAPMCGQDDLIEIERAITKLAQVKEIYDPDAPG